METVLFVVFGNRLVIMPGTQREYAVTKLTFACSEV
jgi:hypothetical protein